MSKKGYRPTRESYARGVLQWGDLELIGGIELRGNAEFRDLRDSMRRKLAAAISVAVGLDEATLACAIETLIKATWPDRAYFIEVGNNSEGWVQIFCPYGIPRDR